MEIWKDVTIKLCMVERCNYNDYSVCEHRIPPWWIIYIFLCALVPECVIKYNYYGMLTFPVSAPLHNKTRNLGAGKNVT